MAEIAFSRNYLPNGIQYNWLNVTESDTCKPVAIPQYDDITVQVSDDFGTSGTVNIQGSAESHLAAASAVFANLSDIDGTAISITSAGFKTVQENAHYYKPVVSAGTSVSVDISVIAK